MEQEGKMTNGEKFREIFSISQVDEGELYAYMWLPSHDAVYIPRDWWNAEYKEPVIRDNGVKNELNRVKDELGVASELEKNSKKLEKDFGELDCISRADAIQAMQDTAKKLTNEDTINGLCGAVAILFDLPSVTPQEPRCKDCKWWKDSDGEYRRGCGAESRCPINTHAVYCGEGYCYKFSPKADMRGKEV